MRYKVKLYCRAPDYTKILICMDAKDRVDLFTQLNKEFDIIPEGVVVSQCLGCETCKSTGSDSAIEQSSKGRS